MMIKSFFASAAALMLIGCATTSGVPGDMDFVDTTSAEGKLLGDYLSGSYADQLKDTDARLEYFGRAFSRAPNDIEIGHRAVKSAVIAGDFKRARQYAKQVLAVDSTEHMSRVVMGTSEFSSGRTAKAESYFAGSSGDVTIEALMNIMRGWNAVDAGEPEKAREIFASISGYGYFGLLGQLQIANMDAGLGDFDGANNSFDLVQTAGLSPTEVVLSKARALIKAGEIDAAVTALEAFNAENGVFEIGPIPNYIRRLEGGKYLPKELTPQQNAARALTESSYGFFLRNRAEEAAEVYLRFALQLDPDHDKAKLWLGSLLEDSSRSDEAMVLFESISAESDYFIFARLSQASIHFANEDDETGIALLNQTNAERPSIVTDETLARVRLNRENYAEALPIYDALIQSMSAEKLKENPDLLYFRGICYERLKRWDEAVADFKAVLEIDPDNADALNYLGYTWVDRNENLEEAFDMIRKAVSLEPNSGAIVDSLGWAHYKLGQYDEAKEQLEKAVELAPSSATIIDHLGDTYWKLGRYREAGYQWARALEFDPTDEERTQIEVKLKGGLDAAQALP